MSELSTEVKAKEIHEKAVGYFKVSEQYGYKFIMEVKKIRDDRYYKELGYSSFNDYCQNAWGVKRNYMNDRIQIAETFNENCDRTCGQFGHSKSLLLARMPEQQREQAINEGIPTKQGKKSVKEATHKEVDEYKRKNNELQQAKQQAEEKNKQLQNQLREEQNTPPKTVEKEIIKEVVPEDIQRKLKEFEEWKKTYTLSKEQEKHLLDQITELEEKLKNGEKQAQDESNIEYLKQQEEELKHKAHISMFDFQLKVNNFIKDASPDVFLQGAMAYADNSVKKEMLETARALEDMTHTLKRILNEKDKYSDMQDAEIIDI